MTRRAGLIIGLGLFVLAASLGLGRLSFNPDPLGMLSPEMSEVRGLKVFHDDFARQDELLILIEGGEEDVGSLALAAESLAEALDEAGIVRRARWKPQWEEEGDGLAELLAYLWLNGPPELVEAQFSRFSGPDARPENELAEALARVATAMEGQDMVMRANDSFGFLRHPSLDVLQSMAEDGAGFESEDGRAHLVLAEAKQHLASYREALEWLEQVRGVVAEWQKEDGAGLEVSLTGEPAFSSEIGSAMENDMRGTVGITAALIGLLFWIAQRRLSLLVGLGGVLALTFVTALGLAGWIYGELSIMAAGFAAILIGLAVDYGVLICQEAKLAGDDAAALTKSTGRSIAAAAATTAAVFLALNLSGLPGIAQLGTIVACGIVAGAALTLGIYLPFVAKSGAGRKISAPNRSGALPSRWAAGITVSLAALACGVLAWQGFPEIGFDTKMMRPRGSPAMAGFERLQASFPAWDSGDLQLVIEADSDEEMRHRKSLALERTAALGEKIERVSIADGWWPDAAHQAANRNNLAALGADRERLIGLAGDAGFSEEGSALASSVMAELARITASAETYFPQSTAALDLMRMFISRDESGGGSLLARVTPAASADPANADYAAFHAISGDGVWLTGWSLLRPAVAPLVKKDLTHVFLPMAGLMVLMLVLLFRSAGEVWRILLAMALSGISLLAAMAALGIDWNFLNIAATPLLLGTGIDYGIHVMLALRRSGGDIAAMWHGTGKAVVFCGCSTAIGFGSLCFASNDAMASLGTISVMGIMISMLVSVFLLPAWRKSSAA